MRNSSNHIKFFKLCSRNWCNFLNIVVPRVIPRRRPWNPRLSTRPPWPLAAIVRKFNPGMVPLSFAEKDQGWVSPVSLYQWLTQWGMGQVEASLSSTRKEHPAQVIYILMNGKLVMWNWQAAVAALQMGNYVMEPLLLWRGTCWESNGEAHIKNPVFVQIRLFCPPNLSPGTALSALCKISWFARSDQNT